ncbi:MAG TPA: hypothetical protein VF941_13425, partial [Clostridia bacterium]
MKIFIILGEWCTIKRVVLIIVSMVLSLTLLSPVFAAAQQANDLSTLGGLHSYARSVNKDGLVVGYSYTSEGQVHAFKYKEGSIIDLGTGTGISSRAYSVNDKSQIVGYIEKEDGENKAVIWTYDVYEVVTPDGLTLTVDKSAINSLGNLGGKYARAYGIDNNGSAVGKSLNSSNQIHAFVWDTASMYDLGTLGGKESCAYSVVESVYAATYTSVSGLL